jgi:hypothetical protein
MCPEQTLKRKNIEKIKASSVTSDEITAQQNELAYAERKLRQVGNSVEKIKDKVGLIRQRLSDARNQYRLKNTKQTQRAFTNASDQLQNIRQEFDNKLSEYREIKLIVRDQRSLVKDLEKKEVAKQKAVARFLKQWECDYDRDMRMKRKTVQKRSRAMKT